MPSPNLHYGIFVLLRALPAWLALPRSERAKIGEAAFAEAFASGTVRMRHFDAEAFSGRCSDIAFLETDTLSDYYFAMERLRDTPIFAHPYFELIDIVPAIEDGYRAFEAGEAAA